MDERTKSPSRTSWKYHKAYGPFDRHRGASEARQPRRIARIQDPRRGEAVTPRCLHRAYVARTSRPRIIPVFIPLPNAPAKLRALRNCARRAVSLSLLLGTDQFFPPEGDDLVGRHQHGNPCLYRVHREAEITGQIRNVEHLGASRRQRADIILHAAGVESQISRTTNQSEGRRIKYSGTGPVATRGHTRER